MLNNKKSLFSAPSNSVPNKLIDSSLSAKEYLIRQCIGGGLNKKIIVEGNVEFTISVSWQDSSVFSIEGASIGLLTTHGYMSFFGYSNFFQTLSGVSLDENADILEKLFPVMVSCIPKSTLDMFGFFSMADNVKSGGQESFCLPLKISANDCTVVAYISADADVWLSFLQKSLWDKSISPAFEEKILPPFSPCVIGSAAILFDDYKSLQVGDLLILDNPLFDVDGVGTVDIGNRSASVVVDEFSLNENGALFLNWCDEHQETLAVDESVDLDDDTYNEELYL